MAKKSPSRVRSFMRPRYWVFMVMPWMVAGCYEYKVAPVNPHPKKIYLAEAVTKDMPADMTATSAIAFYKVVDSDCMPTNYANEGFSKPSTSQQAPASVESLGNGRFLIKAYEDYYAEEKVYSTGGKCRWKFEGISIRYKSKNISRSHGISGEEKESYLGYCNISENSLKFDMCVNNNKNKSAYFESVIKRISK